MMNRSNVTVRNIIAYLQGWYRYYLYYSKFKLLIRKHIRDQIDFRIKYMDKECYENGSCKLCGCATTALQMADKQCDKPCYPNMMNRKDWRMFSKYAGKVDGWRWYKDNIPGLSQEHLISDQEDSFIRRISPQNEI